MRSHRSLGARQQQRSKRQHSSSLFLFRHRNRGPVTCPCHPICWRKHGMQTLCRAATRSCASFHRKMCRWELQQVQTASYIRSNQNRENAVAQSIPTFGAWSLALRESGAVLRYSLLALLRSIRESFCFSVCDCHHMNATRRREHGATKSALLS